MKQIKAGLIAATPVDTRFGLRFLNTLNVEGFTDVLSQNPEEQNYLQLHGKDELEKRCLKKCLEFEKNGAKIIGYANLEIVRQIEAKILPEDIILNNGLIDFLNICHVSNVEILLLGCTHYPLFQKNNFSFFEFELAL